MQKVNQCVWTEDGRDQAVLPITNRPCPPSFFPLDGTEPSTTHGQAMTAGLRVCGSEEAGLEIETREVKRSQALAGTHP